MICLNSSVSAAGEHDVARCAFHLVDFVALLASLEIALDLRLNAGPVQGRDRRTSMSED